LGNIIQWFCTKILFFHPHCQVLFKVCLICQPWQLFRDRYFKRRAHKPFIFLAICFLNEM
jgi:hypothetical protein